ncbi:MAG: flagellum-specific ATP synthase FliI, partial [Alphaproteobacteria bacterium]|nr:flagellum-specific ATP synthase FliI [Alphaproteobacteria bacterium]
MQGLIGEIDRIPETRYHGRVHAVQGLLVEVAGIERAVSIGSRMVLEARGDKRIPSEVVGFREGRALLMAYGSLD